MSGVTTKFGEMGGAGYIGAWLNQSGFGGSVEGALMFLNALELNRADSKIQDTLKSIEASAKLREYLNKRMAKLNELKNYVNSAKDGAEGTAPSRFMKVDTYLEKNYNLPPEPKKPTAPTAPGPNATQAELDAYKKAAADFKSDAPLKEYQAKKADWDKTREAAYQKFVDDFGLTKDNISVDAQTGRLVVAHMGQNLISDYIKADDLDVEIKRLKSEADTADQSRQLQLTMTQTALNQKQQLITLMTNIIKKSHETKSAVLRNIA